MFREKFFDKMSNSPKAEWRVGSPQPAKVTQEGGVSRKLEEQEYSFKSFITCEVGTYSFLSMVKLVVAPHSQYMQSKLQVL